MNLPDLLAAEPAVTPKKPQQTEQMSREGDAFAATFQKERGASDTKDGTFALASDLEGKDSLEDGLAGDSTFSGDVGLPRKSVSLDAGSEHLGAVGGIGSIDNSHEHVLLGSNPVVGVSRGTGTDHPALVAFQSIAMAAPKADSGEARTAVPRELGNSITLAGAEERGLSQPSRAIVDGRGPDEIAVQKSNQNASYPIDKIGREVDRLETVEANTPRASDRVALAPKGADVPPETAVTSAQIAARSASAQAETASIASSARDLGETVWPAQLGRDRDGQAKADRQLSVSRGQALKELDTQATVKQMDLAITSPQKSLRGQAGSSQSAVKPVSFGEATPALSAFADTTISNNMQARAGAITSQDGAAIARHTAPQIANAVIARPNGGTIDIRLDPPELGRVEITLELSDQGLRAALISERASTGDLLRRHADMLMQQFEDSGFEDIDLSFGQEHLNQQDHEGDPPLDNSPSEQVSEPTEDPRARVSVIGQSQVDVVL